MPKPSWHPYPVIASLAVFPHRCRPLVPVLAMLAASAASGLAARPAGAAPKPCDYLLRGNVITLDAARPRASWVAVKDGRIAAVGQDSPSPAAAAPPCAAGTPVVDLKDQVIVPGFIDSHSHLLAYGMASQWVDVSSTNPFFVDPASYTPVVSFDLLKQRLQGALRGNPQGPILGAAFDPSRTVEGRNPSLDELDQVSDQARILLWQASMHGMNANSPLLDCVWERLRCRQPDPCTGPAPGRGVDGSSSSCPGVPPQYVSSFFHGVIEETMLQESMPAIVACVASPVSPTCAGAGGTSVGGGKKSTATGDEGAAKAAALLARSLAKGAEIFARHGFTTGSDIVTSEVTDVYRVAGPAQPMDFVLLPTSVAQRRKMTELLRGAPTLYPGQIKVWADGSIQGRTAFLSQPFLGEPFSRGDMTDANWTLARFIEEAFQAGFPIAVHANGDAAIATTLDLIEANLLRYPGARGLRNMFIHSPMVGRADLERMAALNVMPTFLIQHPYLWGQPVCLTLLGPQRSTERYNPAGLAAEILPRFALHSDAFVSPPDPLRMIWAARTRKVQDVKKLQGLPSGYTASCPEILAPGQRISIAQALRALTLDSAYQFGLEGEKGSIEAGKLADFAVLSADPLTLENEPDALLDIRVLGTVHRGTCHWVDRDKDPCPGGK